MKKKFKTRYIIACVVIILLVVISLAQIVSEKEDDPDAIKILASQLSDDYERNQREADSKYKGKTLTVNGYVERTGKDFSNNIYILLKTDSSIKRVKCVFLKNQKNMLQTIINDSFITVTGQCEGQFVGDVRLTGCSLK